ncbi:RluA family pseudouridine synthase [Anaerococcus jeddahensis]|uniref:RluA family pseudouridine synthase n=1 Tax=Anaerococcus jeddahensis TaxID=1673719 RepID=UPI0006724323|nr:RluA family pseudouridine synthase [Anaerococcus jeddahensis]
MIEVRINENDSNQRFDRFLRKYLKNASLSIIQKNIRKKNFKINDKRAKKDDFVKYGDIIRMYITDEDYQKWVRKDNFEASDFDLDIIYEDENILIIDKKSGVLSHAANASDYGKNLVDQMTSYLYKTNKVNSRDLTFRPSIVNRLDRNTAGLIIGAKNSKTLRSLNEAIRNGKINKYYLTIVEGELKKDFAIDTNISKFENKNMVKDNKEGKRIITKFHPLESKNNFTLLECELITGKTHQIRYSLNKNSTPIIGDRKYSKSKINYKKINLNNQALLAYKLVFGKIENLEYLENKIFISRQVDKINKLKEEVFNASFN